MNSALGVCGQLGRGDDGRARAIARLLGGLPRLIDHDNGVLHGSAACQRWPDTETVAVSWSPSPMPDPVPATTADSLAREYDAASMVLRGDGTAALVTGISGAVPLYADLDGGAVHFASRLGALAVTRPDGRAAPDWDAWAHVIAAGGPLEGRTVFQGIRRLQPWERVTVDTAGTTRRSTPSWPWLEVDSRPDVAVGTGLDAVRDALAEAVATQAGRGPLVSLLSGGWDSRILAAFAANAGADLRARTTSSDTGHVLEELVATKVAARLGIEHAIVQGRWDEFGADLRRFADVVDYQTSFHVWAVPLARAVTGDGETVLDGLGGGIFVGGAFPDPATAGAAVDDRFTRLTHYLDAAGDVLRPHVARQIRERTRASFRVVAEPLADHPYGATFTAYLTRTLPGISLSPYGLFADGGPVATPFLADRVVRAALSIPRAHHADGRLYRPLLHAAAPSLADLPTAADLAPRHRRHLRRVSSVEAAAEVRALLTAGPVAELLAPELARADLDRWCTLLDRTKSQHLLRGLATLALWLDRYGERIATSSPDVFLEPVG